MVRSKKQHTKKPDRPSIGRYFERAGQAVPYLFRTLALIWSAAPTWTVWWIALLLVQGFIPVLIVYLTRPLVNGITAAVASGAGWRPIILPAGLMAAALLLTELLRGATQWIRTVQSELVQDHITALIHRKSLEADLAFYESPEFYDHLHRARDEASYRPIALLETVGNLLRNGLTLVAMLVVLVRFGPWLPVALLASTIPVLAVVLRDAVRMHEFRMRVTPIERRAWYHDWLLTTGDSAAELRLFALGDHLKGIFRELRKRIREERFALVRRQGAGQLFAGVAALAVTAISMVVVLSRTLAGTMSLGDLALFYQAFQQGMSLTRSTLDSVGMLYQNSLFLGSLFEFLALEPRVVSPKQPVAPPIKLRDGIHFENVTFRYPGTGRIALRDFSLTVLAGRLVAIVGPNGAGKSTLLKLLCRFYDPEAGSIHIDGVDLREFSLDELRRRMTVLFQQPIRFNATVRDNIQFGDLSRNGDHTVQDAAAAAGADRFIERLPDGYDQMLGHSFSKGAELSGGEWQRVALARAFLRQAPIIVLDEPTSAMDPWAEADWLQRLRALAAGRTAILITHRFTTAMLADEIHVMDQGRIVESGPHSELIARKGRYADWWAMQNFE